MKGTIRVICHTCGKTDNPLEIDTADPRLRYVQCGHCGSLFPVDFKIRLGVQSEIEGQ